MCIRDSNIPNCQLNGLQQIQNSLARVVYKAPKSCHITPILKSLHWLKINERIQYKLLSLTYKVLTTTKPTYLYNLISVQPPRNTRSSSVVTITRPSSSSSLKITNRSFRYASPQLWNHLPHSFRQHPHHSLSQSLHSTPVSSSPLASSVSPYLTPSIFHSRLKTYLFHKSFPP